MAEFLSTGVYFGALAGGCVVALGVRSIYRSWAYRRRGRNSFGNDTWPPQGRIKK